MKANVTLVAFVLNFICLNLFAQIPLVYPVENTGAASCKAPPLPSFSQLPVIEPLPDPFMWSDGRGRSTSFSDWECRRNEIKAEIENYEIGTKPSRPQNITASYTPGVGTATGTLTVNVTVNGKTLTLTSQVALPTGAGPFPAIIGMNSLSGSIPASVFTGRNIARIQYNHNQVTAYGNPQLTDPYYQLYPDQNLDNAGQYSAWAWGVSRIIDGLELVQASLPVDLKHLGVTGCSYAGKMALFSGAFDERIALTIAQESGGGGAPAWRVSETLGAVEKLGATDYRWFKDDMRQFAGTNVAKLPHDHHELMAMIAPRALLVTGNTDFEWLANPAAYVSARATHEVYKTLGIGDRFGFYIDGGHNHCAVPATQVPAVQAFVDKFMVGDASVNTDITVNPYPQTDYQRWYKWWGTGNAVLPAEPLGKRIWLEAECAAVGSEWQTLADPEASAGKYVVVNGSNSTAAAPAGASGAVTFAFKADTAATYNVVARLNAPTANDDSYWVKFDNGPFVTINGLTTSGWQWLRLTSSTLSVGAHTFTIAYREDGAKLDKLLFTTSNATITGLGAAGTGCTTPVPSAGVFVPTNTTSVGAGPSSPVLGDVDGDGDLDLLVATTSGTVSVRRNTGAGSYSGTQELALDGVARQLVLGDIDADGDLDLVAVLQSGSVRLLRNQGSGVFTSASAPFPATDSGQGIMLGDVDADGDLDLVLTKPTLGLVSVFTNNGMGTFTGSSTSGIAKGINPIPMLADTDGDGDLDLLVSDYSARQARIYINISGAFYGSASTAVGGGGFVDALAVGDIDNDGDPDLLTASYTSSRVSVRRNTNGSFSGTEEVDLQARGPLTLALSDVDGDGDLDLVTTNQNTRTIGVRLNDGKGTFSGNQEVPLNQQVPGGLALGDVDGDGDLDVVTSHAASNLVSVLLNHNQLRTPENPMGTVAGLNYQYYEGAFTQLPNFDALPVLRSGTTPSFDLASVQPRTINYAVRFTGYLQAPTSGPYNFFIYSDDGTQLFLGSTLVVSNDGQHNDAQERSGTIGLQAGTHAMTLNYFQSGGNASLGVYYQGPDGVRRLLPAASLVRVPAVASSVAQASRLAEPTPPTSAALALYPNPSTGRFAVHYVATQDQAATLVISDRVGRQVRQQAVQLQAGDNEVTLDLAGQAQGLYQVLMRPAHDQPQVQKLVLTH
jgi:hypothetical protein